MKKLHRNKHLGCFLGVVLAILTLSGCSQKGVNDDAAPSIALHMKVTEPALIESVTQFLLIVSGPGMETIETELALSGGHLEGEVDVPAGRKRKFEVRALDESGRVIYRGSATVDVVPGETIDLTINLYPVVPLVKLSPRFQEVNTNSPCSVDVKVFNIDSLYSIAFRVYFPGYLLAADSAILGRNLDPNLFLFDLTGQDTGFYAITPLGSAPPIVDQNGNATLATIIFRSLYPEMGTDTALLTIEPTLLWKPGGDSIPVSSVFTDGSTIVVQPDTSGDYAVFFPDSVLEYAIRQTINKPEGDILLSEVLTIDTLFADNPDRLGISDLTGLSNLTNLEFLNMEFNQISSINELSSLTNLGQLFLQQNQIQDISALANLHKLFEVGLEYNLINDIFPLIANDSIGAGDKVWLIGNLLSDTTQVDSLCSRGAAVFLQPGIDWCQPF